MTRRTEQGFTLIETLVAISVLVLAIVVPLRVISQSVKSAALTREKITATHLAQEGIELMNAQYERDSNDVVAGWSKWADENLYARASGFSFEPRTGAYIACTSIDPCSVYVDTNGHTHSSVGTTPTPYTRTLRVRTPLTLTAAEIANAPAVEVESMVTWTNPFNVTSTSSRTVWYYNKYD